MKKPLIIAYYLPQFHPFKENDEWWGKGFTEWTNVGKAKPLFKGHYQPKVPADLGYYDLRLPEVREQQAELAREAGVDGFCYWHYWFGGEGRQLMNRIIDEVAETGKPDFPFCLGWANESWKAKQWNKDGYGDKLLMEQRYEGEEDYRKHYEYVRKLIEKKQYIRIDNKPFFLIYKPEQFKDIEIFIKLWNIWIKEDKIADSFYFVANIDNENLKDVYIKLGFNAITPSQYTRIHHDFVYSNKIKRGIIRLWYKLFNIPQIVKMEKVNKFIINDKIDLCEDVIPILLPQWDHSPRSGRKGTIVINSTPKNFEHQAKRTLELTTRKNNKIILLKSWNEWAEGNFMEPDIQFGKGFINALKESKRLIYGK